MNDDLKLAIEASYLRLTSQFPESKVFQPSGTKIKDFYHVGRRLDEGKKSLLCEVRGGKHRISQKRFAIKTYYLGDGQESSTDIIFTKRRGLKFSMILNEIQAQLLLDHPNICKIHEVFLDSKYIHMVLDLCKGGELYDYLATNKPMTLQEAFPIFVQLLDALDYMRSQSVVHRALSIENIMFYDSEKTQVKIISFSSAAIGERFSEKYGCALYMAPEVFSENYDCRCDVWSLGVSFYSLVVGFQPFQGTGLTEILKKVQSAKLPKNPVWKKLQKTMKSFIKSMLVKEVNRPFAEELLESKFILKYSRRMAEFMFIKVLKTLKPIVPNEEYIIKVQFANRVKKMIVQMLETKKILPNLVYLEEIWKKIDKQHLKIVTVQSMETFFNSVYPDDREEQDHFFDVFRRYDSSKNNTISYIDYLTTLSVISDRNLLIQIFDSLDENSNGLIESIELCKDSSEAEKETFQTMYFEAMGKNTMSKEDLSSLIIKFSS